MGNGKIKIRDFEIESCHAFHLQHDASEPEGMRMPRFRLATVMLLVLIAALYLGIRAQMMRESRVPRSDIDLPIVVLFLGLSPLALMIYAACNGTEKAYARRLERKHLPTSVPQNLVDSDELAP